VFCASFVFAEEQKSSQQEAAVETESAAGTSPAAGGSSLLEAPALTESQNTSGESDQTINDFSLVGYGEKGKKTWDLSGKTADIFVDVVKLSDVIGNLYGKEEDIKLTADKGDFNKVDGKIHMEDNVVITTSTGTRLLTDTLDWDRKNQVVATEDMVCIKRDTMTATAKGAWGNPSLKKVSLKEDVRLDIIPGQGEDKAISEKDKITITCEGPLEIDYEKNIAKFNKKVKVDREDSQIYSDTMDVYFLSGGGGAETKEAPGEKSAGASMGMMGSKIDKIIAKGNVKVIRGENVSTSDQAIFSMADKKLVLSGKPRLLIYSTEGLADASSGNKGPF
jgi:LPS export ABC transporter protein LptC